MAISCLARRHDRQGRNGWEEDVPPSMCSLDQAKIEIVGGRDALPGETGMVKQSGRQNDIGGGAGRWRDGKAVVEEWRAKVA